MDSASHDQASIFLDLLARVEKATWPDRELDFELHIALVADEIWPVTDRLGRVTNPNSRMSDYLLIYRDVINADNQDFDFSRYTASLDAALALVERTYPGVFFHISRFSRDGGAEAHIYPTGDDYLGDAPTPALALLAALLKALYASAPLRSDASDEGPGTPSNPLAQDGEGR